MEFWLDSANIEIIKEAHQLGLLTGVTTNPSIISQANRPFNELVETLLDVQSGPVAVQVVAKDYEEIHKQARELHHLSRRIVVKVPAIAAGYRAIHQLFREGITVMATTILDPIQFYFSLESGASYLAPYFSKIENASDALKLMQKILNSNGYPSKIIAASINSKEQFLECVEIGVSAITIRDSLLMEFLKSSQQTEDFLRKFQEKWQDVPNRPF